MAGREGKTYPADCIDRDYQLRIDGARFAAGWCGTKEFEIEIERISVKAHHLTSGRVGSGQVGSDEILTSIVAR